MGLQAASSSSSSSEAAAAQRERVLVVMDASRSRENVDALDWALKNVVRPKDTVAVLGVLTEIGKKNLCFPLPIGIGISGIWERLEFSSGQPEVDPRELQEEIETKREQYQSSLQPYYRQCRRNEVKLEVKLAAGFCPEKITVEEAQNHNTRWIVLDSHFKKYKVVIYGHVSCNIAVMKGKDVASLMGTKAPPPAAPFTTNQTKELKTGLSNIQEEDSSTQAPHPQSPCWYPLSWRTGFPRAFSQSELEDITNGFSDENMIRDEDGTKLYQGILLETPVLLKCFTENDERFWTKLKILSRVRHRNIMNLVGYCCSGASRFLLCDFPCLGTLEMNLKCDELAEKLSWKARWYIALEIGGCLRYLHEECVDGPIVHLSIGSSSVVFSHGCSTMLCHFITAKCLEDDAAGTEDSPAEFPNEEDEDLISVDVHDYGMLLLELITGQSACLFQAQGEVQSLIDWALPLLENGFLSEVMDPRLEDTSDTSDARVLYPIARAALLCLKNDLGRRFSMSEILAVVRGDQLAISKCQIP